MGSLIVRTIKGVSDNGNIMEDGMYVTGVSTFTGNVTVGGTLTYDDVTNIDSVGVISARSGLKVGPSATGIAATIYSTGDAHFIGIVTAASYYGDAANMTNAGISAGKSVALTAFLGC
jgi:hypothetical protein